jgi:hypothetical protein
MPCQRRTGPYRESGLRLARVKPKPTPGKKFEDALRKVLSVPKKDVDKAIVREKKEREAKRTDQPK